MCANFSGDEVLCEPCQEVRETEKTVAVRKQQLEKPQTVTVEPEYDEAVLQAGRKKETNWVAVQLSIIGVCAVVVILRFVVFPPGNQATDAGNDNLAQIQMLSSLAQCMVQFRQIGESLVAGELPPPNTTCPGSSLSLIVRQTADDVIVSHPQPSIYGYGALTVSRSNPVPQLVPLDSD